MTLENVVLALARLGLTQENLTSISTANISGSYPIFWSFQLPVPYSKQKETSNSLSVLQSTIGQNNSGMSLSFSITGSQVSAEQAGACDYASLMASARAQAQSLAGASSLSLGSIAGLATNVSNISIAACTLTVRYALPNSSTQFAPNNISIAASQVNRIVPDMVSFRIDIESPLTGVLDDINAALQSAGLSGATLGGVQTRPYYDVDPEQSYLDWSYYLTAPLTSPGATVKALLSAQQSVPKQNPALSLSFYIFGTSSSGSQQPASCSQPELVAAAQIQAQKVASAAGVKVGPILSLSSGGMPILGQGFAAGNISSITYASIQPGGSLVLLSGLPSSSCTTTVQFQLLY
ncbi:MAG: hypothetical protein U0Q18_03385 [Bryobacteraceae bacterium]